MTEQHKLDSYILHHAPHIGASAQKFANSFMHYALDNPEMPNSVKAMESWFAFAINAGLEIGKSQERLRAQDVLSVK